MPRAITPELKAHLMSGNLTIAYCCKVTRTDGEVFGFTGHNEHILFGDVVYRADSGVNRTDFLSKAALNVDSMEIIGGINSETITRADILTGRWDKAACEFFIVNYKDLTMGRMILQGGVIGEITMHDNQFVAELRGEMQKLAQEFGRAYLPSCDADYGDARCGHDPTTLTYGQVNGTVETAPSQFQFTDSSLLATDDWYEFGTVEWLTGLNALANIISEVKIYTTGSVTLEEPTPYAISLGDTYQITVGCDKSGGMCKGRFANKINFRGFDKIPGLDRILSGDA